MIITDSRAPAWLQELARFAALKNLLFVHGNIYDLVSYPEEGQSLEEPEWRESDVARFLERFLCGLGYEVVGTVDPVDGLGFAEQEMAVHFDRLAAGRVEPVRPPSARTTTTPAAAEARPESRPAAGRRRQTDLDKALDRIRRVVGNREAPSAFVFHLASRLLVSPEQLQDRELRFFTKVLKTSLESAETRRNGRALRNLMVFVIDKLNDLPHFLYLNNPRARSIHLKLPDSLDRGRFFRRNYDLFHSDAPAGAKDAPVERLGPRFAALTEGLTHYELNSLVSLSRTEKIPVGELERLCERYRYGVHESEWNKIDQGLLADAETRIRKRVKGQDAAVARMLEIIKRARVGLAAGSGRRSNRPRGVLFFAGPTGVGKTEMAKAVAELIFGQEERCIRFDMSEYAFEHADQKLMGAPPGYVGYEEGGQLTNAVKERPFSILLFDEIEKAHGRIFDKFLQILDDGRLTDGKGETVYFSECIIIFTSNLGVAELGEEERRDYERMRATVLAAIDRHFKSDLRRPEILNRFGDNFVVFDFIRADVALEIARMFVEHLKESARSEHGIELEVAPQVAETLVGLAKLEDQGGRGVRNIVDSALVNPLNQLIFDRAIGESTRLVLTGLVDHGPDAAIRYELRHEPPRKVS